MAISMYSDSSSVATLFSGLSKSSTGLEGAISQYSMLKNGSAGRLARAVYSNREAGSGNTSAAGNKSTSDYNYYDHKDSKTAKGEYSYYNYKTGKIEKSGASSASEKTGTSKTDDAKTTSGASQQTKDELSATAEFMSTASKLTSTGSSSVFKKQSTTDENGERTESYNTDNIKKAVSKFVDDYNVMIDKASSSDNKSIASYGRSLQSLTKSESRLLEQVGISIDKDTGTLSLDEEKFASADMNTVKTLFNGNNSYAYQASSKASMMNYYATNDASTNATAYNSSGKTNTNYSAGELWSQYV